VGLTVPASVGNATAFRIRNPVGSNIIAVLEKFYVGFGILDTGANISRGTATTDLGTVAAPLRSGFDNRGRINSTLIVSDQNTAAAAPALGGATTIYQSFQAANSDAELIWYENQEIPLLPGDAVQVASGATNEAMVCTWWWRERFLEDSERA
jgi:hypothetical protein